jgi:hypothetical protein
MHFIGHFILKRAVFWPCLGVFFVMAATGSSLVRAAAPAAPPVQTEPTAPGKEDFGKYLIDHQDVLAPFFQKHSDDLVKQGIPLALQVLGAIVLMNLILGWMFDIGLGYAFSYFFARPQAKVTKALIYATGRLVIMVVLAVLTGLIAFGANMVGPLLVLAVAVLMILVDFVVETIWITVIYRTKFVVAGLFFIALLVTRVIAGALVSGPMIEARVTSKLTQFIDQNLTPVLKNATAEAKHDATAAEAARDKAQADLNAAQDRLNQVTAQADTLRQEIDARKNSDVFAYGRICRTHAQGDLLAARDQLNAFLSKFPPGSLTEAARAQLAMVESELAAQDAQKKQDEADAAQAVAQAQSDFLARASKDGVTLSEARQMLLGKTREAVTSLFGAPTETGPDRLGYSRVIIVNPLTNQKHGLAIYFSEGAVLSVDYYYGGGAAQ